MKTFTTIIGIDPAFRQNGFSICILDLTDNSANFKMFKNGMVDFFFWVLYEAPKDAFWSVENSNLQNTLFYSKGMTKTQAVSRAMSVGKNQATSQNTVDLLTVIFGPESVKGYSPQEKGAKIVNEGIFRAYADEYVLDGYNGNKNEQDKRDAFKMAKIAHCYLLLNGKINKQQKTEQNENETH